MSIVVYATLGLCFAGGVFFLYLGAKNVWWGIASTKWPVADGTIVTSDTELSRSSDGSSTAGALILAKYSKVAYNPSAPDIAALERGLDAEVLWLPGAGLVFALVTVMFTMAYRSSEGASSSGMAMAVAFFAGIFMMTGLPMLIFGGISIYRAHASEFWPKAQGEIVYDDVDVSTSVDRDSKTQRRKTSTTYGARIIFRYDVNGKRHYSNTRRFGALSGSNSEWAFEIADKYPQGYKLPVSYHPEDPDLAVVETGITSEACWLPGTGAAFFLFGLATAVFGIPAMARS